MLDKTNEEDPQHSICAVLSKLGAQDERVFRALCKVFEEDAISGALCFRAYGDPRALPILLKAIENFRPNFDSVLRATDLVELVEAYKHLGGVLPDEIQARVDRWYARWDAMRAKLFAPPHQGRGVEPGKTKVGRNDPCPCGSGKKFKKCCLGKAAESHGSS